MKEYWAVPNAGGRRASGGREAARGWSHRLRVGGVAPGGRGLWEPLVAVLAQAKPKLSLSASRTCLGNPCDCSGPSSRSGSRSRCGCGCRCRCGCRCGFSTGSFFSPTHSGPDSGGGAAGSHPQGSGERERARGLGQDGAGIPGSRRFCLSAVASEPGH